MARPTMAAAIARLRTMTDAALDDEFNGVVYWTDDQLEERLDRRSQDVQVFLTKGTRKVNGAVAWYQMSFTPYFWLEYETTEIVDKNGYTVDDANYTLDTQRGSAVLNSDLAETGYMLRARVYNMYEVAADVWAEKAAQRASYIKYKADIHTVSMEQEYEHCKERELYYRSKTIKRFSA